MDERSAGIILRTYPLTETSLIVQWLTAEQGRLATVAKGARRPASPFRGKLDLFYECAFSLARSRRSELHTLREVFLENNHADLRRELGWLRQAAYAVALIEQNTERGTPLPGCYRLLKSLLAFLPRQPAQPMTLFAFEIKLLAELGLQPDLARAQLSLGAKQILERCLAHDFSGLASLRLAPAQTLELRDFLFDFMNRHLNSVPRPRAAALALP